MQTELDTEYFGALCRAFEDRPTVKSWLYTHGDRDDLETMRAMAPANLAVNWSCDTLAEAQAAQAEGLRGLTAVISLDEATARIKGLTVCPEQTSGIPCAECQLCLKEDRITIVGFIAH